MRVRHEFGIDIIEHDEIFQTMSKDKCIHYCDMLGDCWLDFQPCRGIDGCPFTEEQKRERGWNGDRHLFEIEPKKKHTFNETIDYAVELIKRYNLPFVPSYTDSKNAGFTYASVMKNHMRLISELTGVPLKSDYCRENGLTTAKEKRELIYNYVEKEKHP